MKKNDSSKEQPIRSTITEEEVKELGYSKDSQILDKLYYALDDYNQEERLELLLKLTSKTFSHIPDEDIKNFGFTRERIEELR